ncbi:hypothetical protein PGT21_014019 [Puccinia graminis f. sp. tritici]|uniref:Uncharacterized protein n=1 Tax=Puccinia graminis f. sp. tritici TaxID=56615 RepID=A0A5B0PY01_PUCGR|nr:hypothetical protein PGT21_014019 [Puccinia graminis f. sp. tritici]
MEQLKCVCLISKQKGSKVPTPDPSKEKQISVFSNQFSLSSMNLCTMSATVLLILKLVATNLAMNVPQSSERLGFRKINPNLRNQESKYLLGEETSISQLWCELAHPASGRALTIAIWTLKWALQQAPVLLMKCNQSKPQKNQKVLELSSLKKRTVQYVWRR